MIHNTARCADNDLHAALKRTDLLYDLLAAVDREYLDPGHIFGQTADLLRNLDRKLSCGAQDHCLCLFAFRIDLLQKGDTEGSRFSGSCLCLADHIASFSLHRDRLCLDR